MHKATINSTTSLEVDHKDDIFHINDSPVNWDISTISEGKFHIILNNKSYNAELAEVDYTEKVFHFKINGTTYKVALKDKFDMLLDKLGMSNMTSTRVNQVKAPMPGLMFAIDIKVGDEVQKGDPIMILEAMKMENVLKSPGEGKVKAINVGLGDSVEKNQVLVEFE